MKTRRKRSASPSKFELRRVRNIAKPNEPAEIVAVDPWEWSATQTPAWMTHKKRRAANRRARASRKANRR